MSSHDLRSVDTDYDSRQDEARIAETGLVAQLRMARPVVFDRCWRVSRAQASQTGEGPNVSTTLHYCVQCEGTPDAFTPYRDGIVDPVSSVLEVVGSDVRNFACPLCWGFDRERHLLLYFDALGLWDRVSGNRVLHIAPERDFGRRLRDAAGDYVAGDLNPDAPGVIHVDLTDTPFESDRFDVVVANHVLEHIPRDDLALAEIVRVLAPGGMAILQTPFSPRLATALENPSITEPDIRAALFGQEDHVRVYGLDLVQRISRCGLEVLVYSHVEVLPHIDASRFGVNAKEPLIVGAKSA